MHPHHSMCFARSSLTVSKDTHIVSIHNRSNQRPGVSENLVWKQNQI